MKKTRYALLLLMTFALASCEKEISYSFSEKEDKSLEYFASLKQAIQNELSQDNIGYRSTDFAGEAIFVSEAGLISKERSIALGAKEAKLLVNNINGTVEELDLLGEINELNFYYDDKALLSDSASMGVYVDDSTAYYDVSAATKFFEESGGALREVLEEIIPSSSSSSSSEEGQGESSFDFDLNLPEKGKIVGDSGSEFGAMLALAPYLLKMSAGDVVDSLKDEYDEDPSAFSFSRDKNDVYTFELAPNEEDYLETLILLALDSYFLEQGGSVQIGDATLEQQDVDEALEEIFATVNVDTFLLRSRYKESGFLSFEFNLTLSFDPKLTETSTLDVLTSHLDGFKLAGTFTSIPEEERLISFPDFSTFEEIEFALPEELPSSPDSQGGGTNPA